MALRLIPLVVVTLLACSRSTSVEPGSEEHLVVEAKALIEEAALRPTHVEPAVPGTLAEAAAPFQAAVKESATRYSRWSPELKDELRAVIDGKRELSAVSPQVRVEVLSTAKAAAGLLEASRATSRELPAESDAFRVVLEAQWGDLGLVAQHAARIAAANAWEDVRAQRMPGAIATCLDGIGMARDLSHNALIEQMLASGIGTTVAPVCVATCLADHGSAAEVGNQLLAIVPHFAPVSKTIRQESVFTQLAGFGSTLSKETRSRLPKTADELSSYGAARATEVLFGKFRRALFGGWARRDFALALNEVASAADRDPEAAIAAAEAVNDKVGLTWALSGNADGWSVARLIERRLDLDTRLGAIAAACALAAGVEPEPLLARLPPEARHRVCVTRVSDLFRVVGAMRSTGSVPAEFEIPRR